MKVTAKIGNYDPQKEKFYGTRIDLTIDFEGNPERAIGNSLEVWFFADWIGGHKPSEREGTEPDISGSHYETKADLAVARWICDAINAHAVSVPFPECEDDEDEVF